MAIASDLHGSHIFMDMVSVGATINVMMAASMAKGNTTIENAAKEPHVVDVANFLNSMGANIKGAGTDVIRIKGVDTLHGTSYAVVPDMIEAGTYMFAAAATKGDVLVKNVIPKHLEATTAKLEEIGCDVEEFDDAIRVSASRRLGRTHVKTQPYPGYPTDMQPQIAVTLALANGTSIVTESIFENRFKYALKLRATQLSSTAWRNLPEQRFPHRTFVQAQHLSLQVLQQRVLPWWMILYTFCADTRISTESSADWALRLSV